MSDAPTIVLYLPPPPLANHLWARGGKYGRMRSAEYTAWLRDAGWKARIQLVGMSTITGTFNASITVPISSRRDRDGWSKPIFDLCQHVGAVRNDSGLRDYSVTADEREDVMVALWDCGGPEQRAARALRLGRTWAGKPPATRIQAAHRAGLWR